MRGDVLVPKAFTDKDLKKRIDPTVEDNRALILEILFDGYSRQIFYGVEQGNLHPDNILIRPRKEGGYRVVLINYRHAVVDPLCKKPLDLYGGDDFPNPPHPVNVIHSRDIRSLVGWVPAARATKEEFLVDWLLRTFGSLNSDEYSTEPGWTCDEVEAVSVEGEMEDGPTN